MALSDHRVGFAVLVAVLALVVLAPVAVQASTWQIPAHARGGSVYREEQAAAGAHYRRVWAAAHRHSQGRLAELQSVDVSEPIGAGPNTTVNTFEQFVDHQDPSRGTFSQRWWVDTSMVKPCQASHGASACRQTAMLFIHGEAPASSSPTGYALEYGAAAGSHLFTLEHRFYGESMPGSFTNRRALDMLNVDNVLADLRDFKVAMTRRFFNDDDSSVVWYVVGGSYAGALSVWVRQAYPSDFAAAWSSSGVVNAIFDFSAFDAHVDKVLSRECSRALRGVLADVFHVYEGTDAQARADVDALVSRPVYFSDADVQWMLTDGAAMAVQYGKKEQLCERLLAGQSGPSSSADSTQSIGVVRRLSALVALVKELWGPLFTETCYYSGECLRNASYAALWPTGNYAWVFQCCTELAYWQVSFPHSLRMPAVTSSYFMAQCRDAFGQETFPNTFTFNARHGGATPHTDHVVATQGSDDPWLPAGVDQSLSELYPVLTAQCAGCGHCFDLHAPDPARDPTPLQTQRAQVAAYLNSWLDLPQ